MLEENEESKPGSPPWMATFADLMALLMCFFVLLLSFSQMDVEKYKQVAGSMRNAFGVQNQVKVMDIPKGTSIIAREFSPGKTQPTQMDTVKQFTTETTKPSLQVGNPTAPDLDTSQLNDAQTRALLEEKLQALILATKADAEKLRELLKSDVEDGKIDIEVEGRTITVRIREKGSFPSGSADLNTEFMPVMATLRNALRDIPGKIAVEGHTDDIPISGARFESNWGLSASRALSVTHELAKSNTLDSSRFMVVGHADTQPFKANDSWKNRAMNRRVEIIIRQGDGNVTTKTLQDLQSADPDILQQLNLDVGS